MMKSPEKLTRHQILLFEGDFDKLSDIYRRRRATEVVRTLVREHLRRVDRSKYGPPTRPARHGQRVTERDGGRCGR